MDYLQATILSIVEGLTEFLPISSTGHLILTSTILKIQQTDFVKSFEIIIQLGAIAGVVFLYWRRLFVRNTIWKQMLVALMPTAFFGLVLFKFIKSYLIGNTILTLISLFVGGILLIILEFIYKEKKHHVDKIEQLTLTQSFLIGCCQSIAIIPGVSRAASTIMGALFLGAKRKVAVEFSFLIASPTLLAAAGLDIVKSDFSFSAYEYSLLVIGLIGSFFVAILSMKFFLAFIKNHTFIPFGIYRIVLAVIFAFFVL
ncbi:MAG: undecaprenyl-diphosphatase UppP [Candidatus Levybacteria bacterium]|nr:undecaprenyl-diphosphatase UppP [Candidatus Levybacteria bacterium]